MPSVSPTLSKAWRWITHRVRWELSYRYRAGCQLQTQIDRAGKLVGSLDGKAYTRWRTKTRAVLYHHFGEDSPLSREFDERTAADQTADDVALRQCCEEGQNQLIAARDGVRDRVVELRGHRAETPWLHLIRIGIVGMAAGWLVHRVRWELSYRYRAERQLQEQIERAEALLASFDPADFRRWRAKTFLVLHHIFEETAPAQPKFESRTRSDSEDVATLRRCCRDGKDELIGAREAVHSGGAALRRHASEALWLRLPTRGGFLGGLGAGLATLGIFVNSLFGPSPDHPTYTLPYGIARY